LISFGNSILQVERNDGTETKTTWKPRENELLLQCLPHENPHTQPYKKFSKPYKLIKETLQDKLFQDYGVNYDGELERLYSI